MCVTAISYCRQVGGINALLSRLLQRETSQALWFPRHTLRLRADSLHYNFTDCHVNDSVWTLRWSWSYV